MTPQEINSIAEEASKKTLNDLFERLGIDVNEVVEVQKDMHYLRRQRQASDQIAMWTRRVVLTTFITGSMSALVVGLKVAVTKIV